MRNKNVTLTTMMNSPNFYLLDTCNYKNNFHIKLHCETGILVQSLNVSCPLVAICRIFCVKSLGSLEGVNMSECEYLDSHMN